MPERDLHAKPFTEETLAKLRIFENYIQEWLPTFVMSGYSNVCIFDFFAGSGYDVSKSAGSPIRILNQIEKNKNIIINKKTTVNVYLNEFNKDKYENLQQACLEKIQSSADLTELKEKNKLVLYFYNSDCMELFNILLPTIKSNVSLVFLDQNGVKFITDEIFIPLTNTTKTDFLYFVASSNINRFKDTDNFKKYIDFSFDDIEKGTFNFIHIHLIEKLKQKIPVQSKVKLYPFTIKKGRNIYGIVFGSSHIRGVDKFLKTAWKENPENGEANFDLYDDDMGIIDLFEGPHLSKIDKFKKELEEKIKTRQLITNKDVYDYTLEKGHIAKHATDALREMKKNQQVSFLSSSPKISYENCYGKEKQIINFDITQK